MNTIAFFKPRKENTLASALWMCVVMQRGFSAVLLGLTCVAQHWYEEIYGFS